MGTVWICVLHPSVSIATNQKVTGSHCLHWLVAKVLARLLSVSYEPSSPWGSLVGPGMASDTIPSGFT